MINSLTKNMIPSFEKLTMHLFNKKRKRTRKKVTSCACLKLTMDDVKRDLHIEEKYIKFITNKCNIYFQTHSDLLPPWMKLKCDPLIILEDKVLDIFHCNIDTFNGMKHNKIINNVRNVLNSTILIPVLTDIVAGYIHETEEVNLKCYVKQSNYYGTYKLWYYIELKFVDVYDIVFSYKYRQLCHYGFDTGHSYNYGFNFNFRNMISTLPKTYSNEQINIIVPILHCVYYNIEIIMNSMFERKHAITYE